MKLDVAAAEELLARLRPVLPPIHRNPEAGPSGWPAVPTGFLVIDLEWEKGNPDRLECVGIGNARGVLQYWWQELTDVEREACRRFVQVLVRTTHLVYHNADADIRVMRRHRFDVSVEAHLRLDDTMLAHSILNAELPNGLGELNERYGKLPPYKALQNYIPAASEYNAADLMSTAIIWEHAIEPQLRADPQAAALYQHTMLPFLSLAIEGEEAGIAVNRPAVPPLRAECEQRIADGVGLAQAAVGWPINLNSPPQMRHQLYVVEGLPEQRGKAVGHDEPSLTTAKDAIAALRRLHGTEWDAEEDPTLAQARANIEAGGHPLLEAKYLFSGAEQMLSHYIMPFYDEHCVVRDRIYPEVRQHVQSSGRHSYVGPAVQQMRDKRLQNLMRPDDGHVWVGHDWSNIEVWILAYLARDPLLLQTKAEGWDTHTVNYCDIAGIPYPPVLTKALHTSPLCADWRAAHRWQGDEDLRRLFTKRFIFRLHYRGKPENAGDIPGAKALGFNEARLIEASTRYLSRHEPVARYWQELEQLIDQTSCVRTFMGRPRRLTAQWRGARLREGCNHPMQGGVADIYVTTALLVKRAAPWARLVYGAHDAMWWQVPVERELEFSLLYAPIVTRDFTINNQTASFAASFKRRAA